jgi:sodium-dependent dicarboxylate transporter 2/3/5
MMLPFIINVINMIQDEAGKKLVATNLMLALVYGANIGGAGMLNGSALNVVYLGFIEYQNLIGREGITFFSWMVVGIPGTLVLILLARFVLKMDEKELFLEHHVKLEETTEKPRKYYYLYTFVLTIIFFLVLSAIQTLGQPPKLLAGLNYVDLIFTGYFLIFIIWVFIIPQQTRDLENYLKNTVFFILQLVLIPFLFLLGLFEAFEERFNLGFGKIIQFFEKMLTSIYNHIWHLFFGERDINIKHANQSVFISINRLFHDLPYIGIVAWSFIFFLAYLFFHLGDDPTTVMVDGYFMRMFNHLTDFISDLGIPITIFLYISVYLSIFLTEILSNTAVLLVFFPTILKVSIASGWPVVYTLLAVTIGASAAFMSPIATSVNAISFTSIPYVSLKKMIKLGFIMNIIGGFWICLVIYFLILVT